LKLYHCKDARSLRPLWALEELGLPYELVNMPFPPRVKEKGYLDINPLGTVPTLLDGDLTLTESTAICQYLAEKYQPNALTLSVQHAEYGDYLNWLHRSDTTFTFPQALILRYERFEPDQRKQPQVVQDYSQWLMSRLRCIEVVVSNKEYLCSNKFTIADICVGYALYLADKINLSHGFGINTKTYLQRLMKREGFKKALKRQNALKDIF